MSTLKRVRCAEAGMIGHPDKVADLIGDSILDAILRQDKLGRGGVQVMVTGTMVVVGGQIRTTADIDVHEIVCEVVSAIGYGDPIWGFPVQSLEVIDRLAQQTDELSNNVERGGAGDSACISGHACSDCAAMVPMAHHISQTFATAIHRARIAGFLQGIGPDGKIQVGVEYIDGIPSRLDSVILSLQNSGDADLAAAHEYIRDLLIPAIMPDGFVDSKTILRFKSSVGFTVGGPRADTGLSSRKVVSDTYGSDVAWGGGGLSGKDPTKIDRCGGYLARYLAKNIVAAGFGTSCNVMLGYAIGSPQPLLIDVDLARRGGDDMRESILAHLQKQDLSPTAAIQILDLRRPIYASLSFGGHFGANAAKYEWEQIRPIFQGL